MVDVKGELVVVVEGNTEEKTYDNLSIIEHVNLYIMNGMDKKEALKKVSKDRGMSKSDVYKEYHRGDV